MPDMLVKLTSFLDHCDATAPLEDDDEPVLAQVLVLPVFHHSYLSTLHPTTIREDTSSTTARESHPCVVGIDVMLGRDPAP